jgi:hypothetical protein
MSLSLLDLDWLNQNANRAYPLDEEAGGRDLSGLYALPKSFLVDFLWPVHAAFGQDCARFFLSSVTTAGETVRGTVSYSPSDDDEALAVGVFSVDRATHVRNRVYPVIGQGEFADSVGRAAVGDLADLYAEGGSLVFDLAGGRLNPTCVRPNLRGVSGLIVENAGAAGDLLTGDVELVAGRGVRLAVLEGNRVRIDATSDESLREDCACDAAGLCVQTINGVPPDANGDFRLVGDDCLEIEAVSHGLQLLDRCSRSCCGCDELKVVVDAAASFGEQLNQLEIATQRLESQLANSVDNILASRINAAGCP